mgnify:CR=1 FL=1
MRGGESTTLSAIYPNDFLLYPKYALYKKYKPRTKRLFLILLFSPIIVLLFLSIYQPFVAIRSLYYTFHLLSAVHLHGTHS